MKYPLILITLFFFINGFSQIDNFRFKKYLAESPNQLTAFAIPFNGEHSLRILKDKKINIKSITKNWIYIQATPNDIQQLFNEKKIEHFYFEFQNGQPLSDTARIVQHVKEVQEGYGDLLRGYTGENVLIGFVDTGLDWTHPDFQDENGVPRVIAYWKQGPGTDATAPQPFGYGKSCDSLSIVNGTCPLTEPTSGYGHGTSVTGAATGNGRANGKEIGMATKAKIVAIQTDFSLQNWTLTVADACDYVFRIADSLGIPAVMNLSVGSYYGSHDGNDPASELMEQLVDSKKGRIIVGAMGNSGDKGNYHLKGKIYQDTNFVWFKNNPTNQILANSIYFDWWSDTVSSQQLKIAFAANDPITFEQTPYTTFIKLQNMASSQIDTLRKSNGEALAVVEIYKTLVGDSYEVEALIRSYDSLHYYYQLAVTGVGEFDLWSGKWADLNEMVMDVPSEAEFPAIRNYIFPDSLSTIVSSWACSEKMVTVGNLRNRLTHINNNGVEHPYDPLPPIGYIANSSSRGPSRKGVMKPDVVSNGDMMMGAAPSFMRTNPSYNSTLEIGGWHMRNGGTSMASPVVAGIAALYLEKCSAASYQDFMRDLHKNTDVFEHYGQMPNYTYGNGRINAYKTLVHNGAFTNDFGYCGSDFILGVDSMENYRNFQWSTGETTHEITVNQPGTYEVSFEYADNCYSTISKEVEVGLPPVQPTITSNGNILSSSSADFYQWYKDGQLLTGETNQTLVITSGGYYQVKVSDSANCSNYSDYFHSTLSVEELSNAILIYPNPTFGELFIQSDLMIDEYQILDLNGRILISDEYKGMSIRLGQLTKGYYILKMKGLSFSKSFKFLKM